MALKLYVHRPINTIQFHVSDSPDVVDELAFIYLLQMRFDADLEVEDTFYNVVENTKQKTFHISLEFPSFNQFSDAQIHCGRNLKNGKIVSDYLGALDHADPGRLETQKLYAKVLAAHIKK